MRKLLVLVLMVAGCAAQVNPVVQHDDTTILSIVPDGGPVTGFPGHYFAAQFSSCINPAGMRGTVCCLYAEPYGLGHDPAVYSLCTDIFGVPGQTIMISMNHKVIHIETCHDGVFCADHLSMPYSEKLPLYMSLSSSYDVLK